MSIFEKALESAMIPATEEIGDYRVGGILYCGKCHTPKEMRLNLLDADRLVRILCKCESDAYDEEQSIRKKNGRRAQAEETMRVLESMGVVMIPYATFACSDSSNMKFEQIMRKYSDRFDIATEGNIGMMLCGKTGCGKTFFAQCIANDLISKGLMVMYSSIQKLAEAPKDEKSFVTRCIASCDLLILDDFGSERDTEFMGERTFDIINTRYEAKKPLLVTTNMNPNTMATETDVRYARSYQRILEMCKPIVISGGERRSNKAAEKAATWKRLME